jgi:hypothetical protein
MVVAWGGSPDLDLPSSIDQTIDQLASKPSGHASGTSQQPLRPHLSHNNLLIWARTHLYHGSVTPTRRTDTAQSRTRSRSLQGIFR